MYSSFLLGSMRYYFNYLLVTAIFTIGLGACTEQKVDTPRWRLKSVQLDGKTTKEYTYDDQNRLVIINNPDYGVFVTNQYDDSLKKFVQINQYPIHSDKTTGTSFRFPYPLSRTSFMVQIRPIKNSIVDNSYYGVIESASYGYDDLRNHLSIYRWKGVTTGGSGLKESDYWFTGENSTTETFHYPNNYADTTLYEYDDKINPFYLSIDPQIDDIARFSRNNVIKKTAYWYPSNSIPAQQYSYEYEYNQQGLPSKQVLKQSSKVLAVYTYTYESY